MKRKILPILSILFPGLLLTGSSRAQGFDVQQLILDIQKLSTLKSILADMQQGYEELDKDYSAVRDVARGNFNLHKAFLDGLLAVSPVVQNYRRAADIVELQHNLATVAAADRRHQILEIFRTVFEGRLTVPVHAFRFTEQAEGWVLSLAADLLGDPRISGVRGAALARSGQSRWTQLAPSGGLAARLGWLLADLAEDLATPRPGPLDDSLAARLALLLAWSAEALAEGPAPRPASPRATLVARFRALVDLHFRDRWPIPRYAHELGTTPVTLTRCCREELGRAPGDVVLDRVLLEALRLLTYTSASASQIAGELGFAEPGYFARFFRARTGMTATAFRRSRGWLEGRPAGG